MISVEEALQMVERAVSLLDPIEFEIEGLEGAYLPSISSDYFRPDEETYLGLFSGSLPVIKIRNTNKNQGELRPVSFSSQEEVNQAVQSLWKAETEMLLRPKSVSRQAWAQGDEFYDKIQNLMLDPQVSCTASWEEFCRFSQAFTNPGEEVDFKPEYVYLDDSGGFKYRGAWVASLTLSSVSNEEITFICPSLPRMEGESIKHDFGSWNAYAFEQNAVFLFKSCNNNTLIAVATTFEQGGNGVKIYIDNPDCSYARFFVNESSSD